MLTYKDLTPIQKKFICNGCGSKGGIIKVPNFLFLASCNKHDFYFWRGGDSLEFIMANVLFYWFMLKDAWSALWYKRLYYIFWATAYFIAVMIGGWRVFNFSFRQKDLIDLQREMTT